jgi:DNA-binding transcriptional LysR family regulator
MKVSIRFRMPAMARQKPPEWNDLHDVLRVHEAGSLSGAARVAGVSQSTMSRRIAAIESGGRRVFLRDADGGMCLTERGAAMVAAARRMRAGFASGAAAFGAPPQPLRIAACEVTARLFIAHALPDWSRRSEIPADLVVLDDLFALSPSEYDVLVMPAEGPLPGTIGSEIGRIEWGLFAAPSYLAARPVVAGGGTLDGHQVIRASGSLAMIAGYRWLDGAGGRTALLSSSPLAQREACIRGQGIALLPLAMGEGDALLERIDMPVPGCVQVWLMADADGASHARTSGFLRWARRRFGGPAPEASAPAAPRR